MENDLIQFYKEQYLLDAQEESKEQLKEVKRLNDLKKKENEVINQWLKGVQPDDVIRPLYRQIMKKKVEIYKKNIDNWF